MTRRWWHPNLSGRLDSARCDVVRYPQVPMGEVTEADFENAPRCHLRAGHRGGHDFTQDPDGTQDEYRVAITTPTCAKCGRTYSPVALHICTQPAASVCVVPSCRWKGTDHAGFCREIDGNLSIGFDRGPLASCGDPECGEEHGDEADPLDEYRAMQADIAKLVEASSLGSPEAKALRESVSDETAARIMRRVRELQAQDDEQTPTGGDLPPGNPGARTSNSSPPVGHGDEDAHEHSGDFFSRVVCGCGWMHTYCDCGEQMEPCAEEDNVTWTSQQKYRYLGNYPEPDVPLAPWGGPAPQPKLAARRGLARAWFVRAAIVVLAVVLVLLLGWVR